MSQHHVTGGKPYLPSPSRRSGHGIAELEELKAEVAKIPAGLKSGVKLPHIEKAKGNLADDTEKLKKVLDYLENLGIVEK